MPGGYCDRSVHSPTPWRRGGGGLWRGGGWFSCGEAVQNDEGRFGLYSNTGYVAMRGWDQKRAVDADGLKALMPFHPALWAGVHVDWRGSIRGGRWVARIGAITLPFVNALFAVVNYVGWWPPGGGGKASDLVRCPRGGRGGGVMKCVLNAVDSTCV